MTKTIGICTMEKFDNRLPNTVGSSRIRARWVLEYWGEAEEYQIGKAYKTIIYQKVYWKNMMERFDGVQIIDLCDPDWLERKPVFEYVDLADAVVTSTEALAAYVRKMRPEQEVWCIHDRVFLPEHKPIKTEHSDELKKVVWYGYHQNFHYLYKALDEIINRGLELTVIGDQPFDAPPGYHQLRVHNIPYTYPAVHQELTRHDVLIMPDPTDDPRGEYKSNNKVLTAMALGLPVVKTPQDLERLKTKEAREKAAQEGIVEIGQKWDVKYSALEYQRLVAELWKKRENNK